MRSLTRISPAFFCSLFIDPKKIFGLLVIFVLAHNNLEAQAPKIVIEQSANGAVAESISPTRWIKGHLNKNNSHYAENQSISYRAIVDNIPLSCPIKIRLSFYFEKRGKYATDFLTSYDVSSVNHNQVFGHASETINPLEGLTGSFTPRSNFPFPVPNDYLLPGVINSNVTVFLNFSAQFGTQLSIWNGTISSIVFVGYNFSGKELFDVTFTPTNLPVVFAWGGHIASHIDYGIETAGAGSSGLGGLNLDGCTASATFQSSTDALASGNGDDGFSGGGEEITYDIIAGGGKPINPTSPNKSELQREGIAIEQKPIVFPNPNKGNTTVTLPSNSESFEIRLIDVSGRIIKSWNEFKASRLELTGLKPGMYLLNINSRTTRQRTVHKVIVLN